MGTPRDVRAKRPWLDNHGPAHMNRELHSAHRGQFYKPDDRRPVAPHRSEFVHAVRANRSGRVIGWYQSQINKASRPYHSGLERGVMMMLDLTPNVLSFDAQPETIAFEHKGEQRPYTPDLRVELTSHARIYLEVKPKAYVLEPDTRLRLLAAAAAIQKLGAAFRIITDEDLAVEPRRSNIDSLQLFRSISPDEETTYRIDVLLGQVDSAPLGALARLCPDPVFGRQTVMSLIYRRHLAINLNAFITDESPVQHTATP